MTDERRPTFADLWALGYCALVPIVPPGAQLSERSTLWKRMQKNPKADARGKAPGVRGEDGLWRSFRWHDHETTPADLVAWTDMGAGVGIRTGDGLALIDADTLREDRARIVRDTIAEILGPLPVRVGNYPKAGYLVRTDASLGYTRIEFGPQIAGASERVEILTHGRQFVAVGVHPKTCLTYRWPNGLPALADVPYHPSAELLRLLDVLRTRLPEASAVVTEGVSDGTTPVDQSSLAGRLEDVRAAVLALPNGAEHASREAYLEVGYAIKAALPDTPHEALEIFQEWAERWTDGENDTETVEADWSRMHPPFRVGAQWLYAEAERLSDGRFQRATTWFEPVAAPAPSPFDEPALRERETLADLYPLVRMGEIINREPQPFLIERHVPEQSVGFLYGDPGCGKSFLALCIALHVVYGLPTWNGDKIRLTERKLVLYVAAEGVHGFRSRIRVWLHHHGIDRHSDDFVLLEQTINFMRADDVEKLIRTLRAAAGSLGVALVIIDTVSRAMPGADENLQKDMTLFVRAVDRVRAEFSCAVIGVHHAGKSGDMRGSTVLLGAGDFVFSLHREKGKSVGRLTCEKQKDAPDGWTEPYLFNEVALPDGTSSLVPTRLETSVGPEAEVTRDTTAAAMRAIAAAWEAGAPWAKTARAGERHYVRRLVRDLGFTASSAEEAMSMWEKCGMVVYDQFDRKAKRSGYRTAEQPSAPAEDGGGASSVFD